MQSSIEQRRLRADAQRQHGVFTLQQALEAGYSRSSVRRQVQRGTWEQVGPRVFRSLPAARLAWRAALMALTLSSGSVASRRSAAALLGLLPEGRLEATVARTVRCSSRLALHSTDSLPGCDVTVVDGIPSTSPVRTLLDLGAVLDRRRFEDVLDTALVRRLVASDELARRAEDLRAPARSGCAVVLALLDARAPGRGHTWSVWEARLLREFCRRGLPEPECNHPVIIRGKTRYLDFAWPARKVAVEFDGFAFHAGRQAFDNDRDRQNDLVDEGWCVFRLTSTALIRDPSRALAPIVRALAPTR